MQTLGRTGGFFYGDRLDERSPCRAIAKIYINFFADRPRSKKIIDMMNSKLSSSDRLHKGGTIPRRPLSKKKVLALCKRSR
ncbi:hypothetical protein JJD41_06645 [Oxynema sp. CENA135]|nr:hypothetical protein [Oxynema sp. CENA135]